MYTTKSVIFCVIYYFVCARVNVSGEVNLGKLELFTNSGWPRHNITSDDVELLDTRRIAIRGLILYDEEPSAFWSVRLKSAPNATSPPLDQLGKYRDNIILSDPLVHSTGCGNPMNVIGKKRDVILTLPKEYSWKDVAWLGIYSYSYTYVLNYIWISHYPNGVPRKMPFLPDGTEDLVTDPPVCNRTLSPCSSSSNNFQQSDSNFCYRPCEEIPEQNERYHCGDKLRNDGKLFGCVGIRSIELNNGEKLPTRECIPGTTLRNRLDSILNINHQNEINLLTVPLPSAILTAPSEIVPVPLSLENGIISTSRPNTNNRFRTLGRYKGTFPRVRPYRFTRL